MHGKECFVTPRDSHITDLVELANLHSHHTMNEKVRHFHTDLSKFLLGQFVYINCVSYQYKNKEYVLV
jgi:hypothetical protein